MLRFHYFIFESDRNGHSHPVFDCYDHEQARQECRLLQTTSYNRGLFYVVTRIDALDLTRTESFVHLVYLTREVQKEYFKTRDPATMKKAMAGERQIDEWIVRYVRYIDTHPDYHLPFEHDQQLFDTVRIWREAMKEWSRHKPKDDRKRRLKEKCQGYEATIDSIISYRLNNYREFRG